MFLFTSPDPASLGPAASGRQDRTALAAGSSEGPVTDAIRGASASTGVSFDYLLDTARRESGLNPAAKASGSSASGLYQFIDSTWLQMVKEAGPSLGLSEAASHIQRTGSGYAADSPAAREAVLALRQDPTASAMVAAAFTRGNADSLTGSLGRAPSPGELYIAHLMGASGAAALIGLAAKSPSADAVAAFPAQAAANPAIFRESGGAARSVGTVYAALARSGGPAAVAATAVAATQGTGDDASADLGSGAWLGVPAARAPSPFTGLFRTDATGPLSKVVQAWADVPASALPASAVPGSTTVSPVAPTLPTPPRLAASAAPAVVAPSVAPPSGTVFGSIGSFVSGLFAKPAATGAAG